MVIRPIVILAYLDERSPPANSARCGDLQRGMGRARGVDGGCTGPVGCVQRSVTCEELALAMYSASACDLKGRWKLVLAVSVFFSFLESARSSPFSPHPLPLHATDGSSPAFFDGWYFRTTDHDRNLSFAVILGSLQPRGTAGWDQSYAALIVSDASKPGTNGAATHIFTEQMFQPNVSITVGTGPWRRPVTQEPPPDAPAVFDYCTPAGCFSVRDDYANLTMAFPSYTVSVTAQARVPWSTDRPNADGPEGLLFPKVRGALLPCHYFVHSLGSLATYRLEPATSRGRDASADTPQPTFLQSASRQLQPSAAAEAGSRVRIEGHGFAHMETNYGTAFPRGWIWSQGIAVGGNSQFVATAFKVTLSNEQGGELESNASRQAPHLPEPDVFAFAYRSPSFNLTLRTPDLASVELHRTACSGTLVLRAHNLLRTRVATLTLVSATATGSARDFSKPLYAPTRDGFSNTPGCVESFSAFGTLNVTDGDGRTIAADTFPLAALEFGGLWRCTTFLGIHGL
eukprot:6207545-Pleurochrysis_carterae.AAC.5